MPFEKKRKKVGGRQKGTPNKKTAIADELCDHILSNGWRDIDKIWNALKPREQMEFVLKMLPFKKPQMARIENENKTPQNITINMIAANKEEVKQIDNTINIKHEEIDD